MSTTDPLLGKLVADRYEIGSLIKSGGMGAVYRARQHTLGRDVAIKFLRPQVVGAGSSQRFMTEARAASRMNHPHVVSVFDFGRTSEADGELLFLVMELVSGLDLSESLVHGGVLPLSRVPTITSQTLQALAEAHHHGIIHRDIKPANILLSHTRSGRDHVKVIDFGIARVQSEQRITEARALCGTAAYIAPELALGEAPGPAADLYSVGVVMFELLTGRLPFEHESPGALLLAHIGAPRPDPRKVAPDRDIPAALAEVCLRALAIRPEERFPNAEEFDQALWSAARELGDPRRPARSLSTPPPPPSPPRGATMRYGSLALPEPEQAAPPLIGREAELAWGRSQLRASLGRSWIELTGRPGVGKTRLLSALGELAEGEGCRVLAITLDPPPYDELGYRGLRQLVMQLSGLELGELGTGGHGQGVIDKRALEGLRALAPRGPARRGDPTTTRNDVAAALAWAARQARARAGGARTVVLVDDIDRLDIASRSALVEQQRSEPVAGLVIVSTGERKISPDVDDDRIVTREIAGLSRTCAMRMLATRRREVTLTRSDDDIEPLYVELVGLLSAARAQVAPATLDGLVEWRVNALSAAQRKVLQAVAVVGMVREGEVDELLCQHGEPPAALSDTQTSLSPLCDAGLLSIRDRQLLVSHRVFGRVAVAHAPGGVIAEIHAAAERQLGSTQAWLELRAYHGIRGRGDFAAFLAMEEVARIRAKRGDATGAIAALWQTVSTARMQIMRGEGGAATAALSVFGRKLASALINDDRLDEAQGILDEILIVGEPTDVGRALVLEQLAAVEHLRGRPEESARHRREALDIAERSEDDNTVERLRAFVGPPASSDYQEPASSVRSQPGRRPVLVVEDDRAIREGLQSVIESDGRAAYGASNGRHALQVLSSMPRPGLILLDLMMPVMTGWELLERLRRDDDFASIPVVVVSAVSKREEPGAVRVVQKPVEVNTLLTLVQEYCD